MKSYKYIFILAIVVLTAGCASTGELAEKKQLERELQQKQVQKALESGNFIIKANKLITRHYRRMDLRPNQNYILVENDRARINMAYVGRSFSNRPISAINVSGHLEEIDITPKKKGSNLIQMRVKGSGELFKISIHLSASGDCTIDINNARLDHVFYNGKLSASL